MPCQTVIFGRAATCSGFHIHPAGNPKHYPVLVVHHRAVYHCGPQALVELGDELRQILHAPDVG